MSPTPSISSIKPSLKKKLILALDGTWQDGTTERDRERSTNIWKLARAINRRDENGCPQVVYYQSGVGTVDKTFGDRFVNDIESVVGGTTGAGLATKVREAYLFIARNWEAGDEIYIFGFSRGAYTARTVAALIGDIGLLGKEDLEYFWSIYEHYQLEGLHSQASPSSTSKRLKAEAEAFLRPWREKKKEWERANAAAIGRFVIKVLGVFDTVGALGIPGFVPKHINFFGFNDLKLGHHIENAYHAMALNENRAVFPVTKWEFDENHSPAKGQMVEQVWFAGSHSDIGGGWKESDLSVITLVWMADHVKEMLSLDEHYLLHDHRFKPHRPWGNYPPHDPYSSSQPHKRHSSLFTPFTHFRTKHVRLSGGSSSTFHPLNRPKELLHPSVYEQRYDDCAWLWPQELRKTIDDACGVVDRVGKLGAWETMLRNGGVFGVERIMECNKSADADAQGIMGVPGRHSMEHEQPRLSDEKQLQQMMGRVKSHSRRADAEMLPN